MPAGEQAVYSRVERLSLWEQAQYDIIALCRKIYYTTSSTSSRDQKALYNPYLKSMVVEGSYFDLSSILSLHDSQNSSQP